MNVTPTVGAGHVCPPALVPRPDDVTAVPHLVSAHPEQGWSLLCDGTTVFDDSGEPLPDGRVIAPQRPTVATAA